MRLRRTLLIVVLVASAGLVLNCRRPTVPAAPSARWLRWAIAREPQALVPARCGSRECLRHLALVALGLTRAEFVGGELKAVPGAAASWTQVSPLEYRFTLRAGLRWSDGRPVVAESFVRGIRRALAQWREEATKHGRASFPLLLISGARNFCEKRGRWDDVAVSVVKTSIGEQIRFRLEKPAPLFPLALASPAALPEAPETDGLPASLGPFFVEKWNRDHEIRYARNPYSPTPAPLGGIAARVVTSGAERLRLFWNGETDLVDEVPEPLVPQVALSESAIAVPDGSVVVLVFHDGKRPFELPALRRRFLHALDRNELVRLMGGSARPATRLSPLADPYSAVQAPHLGLFPLLSELSLGSAELEPLTAEEKARLQGKSLPLAVDSAALEIPSVALQAQWLARFDVKVDISGPRHGGAASPATANMRLVAFPLPPLAPGTLYEAIAEEAMDLGGEPPGTGPAAQWEALGPAIARATDSAELRSAVDTAEAWLVDKQALALPLYYPSRTSLRSSALAGIKVGPWGEWDLRAVQP